MNNISMREAQIERRRKPRISQPFKVKVSGKDLLGEAFELNTVIDNMSATGVFLKLPLDVSFGAKLSMLVHFTTLHEEDREVSKVFLEAIVIRKQLLQEKSWGVAFMITKRRFV